MWWRDRRTYALVCVGIFMSWSYRTGLRNLRDEELSTWIAFVELWLPTAVFLGLLVTFVTPAVKKWLRERRRRHGR